MADSKVPDGLNTILADAIVFYQKLHNYHWMVEGKHFFGLHEKFEELYDRWAEVMDDVAERVLTIGGRPVPTLADALKAATIEEDGSKPDAKDMVKIVLTDLQQQLENMRKTIAAAEEADDRGTANLLDEFCDEIEKTNWMLTAWLA